MGIYIYTLRKSNPIQVSPDILAYRLVYLAKANTWHDDNITKMHVTKAEDLWSETLPVFYVYGLTHDKKKGSPEKGDLLYKARACDVGVWYDCSDLPGEKHAEYDGSKWVFSHPDYLPKEDTVSMTDAGWSQETSDVADKFLNNLIELANHAKDTPVEKTTEPAKEQAKEADMNELTELTEEQAGMAAATLAAGAPLLWMDSKGRAYLKARIQNGQMRFSSGFIPWGKGPNAAVANEYAKQCLECWLVDLGIAVDVEKRSHSWRAMAPVDTSAVALIKRAQPAQVWIFGKDAQIHA